MSSSNDENVGAVESQGKSPLKWLNKKILLLAAGSIGIVFGDIGTSPLYAIKECFHGKHAIVPNVTNVFGVLSLIFWSMIIVVSIKYVTFILRADNRGEGGIFALLGLLNTSDKSRSRISPRPFLCLPGFWERGFFMGTESSHPPYPFFPPLKALKSPQRLRRLLCCL